MEAVQISSQWYIVRYDGPKMTVVDGPYPEKWQAISMGRLNEI